MQVTQGSARCNHIVIPYDAATQATSQASPPNPIGTCCRQNRIHSNPPARIFDGSGSCELVERGLRCVIGRIGNTRVADGGDRGDIDDRAATLGTGARFNRGRGCGLGAYELDAVMEFCSERAVGVAVPR
jgi:hypothetical protein